MKRSSQVLSLILQLYLQYLESFVIYYFTILARCKIDIGLISYFTIIARCKIDVGSFHILLT
jgi:hypothetical protein